MNYPIWEVPASGLLIAGIAILHVFISHFAVGGGLFLVLAERKALRDGDTAFMGYIRGMARFFILLTLVLGAVTGVGIWFTIGLIHPSATSSLINTFVWGWAIEWCFFAVEIAAALVYYYTWGKIDDRTHLAVGWIYFVSAWMSLVVINGILAYMMTPGAWLETRGFWDGFFNPTYFSTLVLRTLAAIGIAGLYALFAASWSTDGALKEKVARWTTAWWIVPAAIGVPLSMLWFFDDAASAGIPVAGILGAADSSVSAIIASAFTTSFESGYPQVIRAMQTMLVALPILVLVPLGIAVLRPRRYGRLVTAALLVVGMLGLGAGEWAREGLRKPWVIGEYMYVHGARVPAPEGVPHPPIEMPDRFARDALDEVGVLKASFWSRVPDGYEPGVGPRDELSPEERAHAEEQAGREMFKMLCSQCHTVDGYNAVRPLVQGWSVGAAERLLDRLEIHRERRMPPFVGKADEKRALAVYLARLGGDASAGVVQPAPEETSLGAELFDEQCSICHTEDMGYPMAEYVEGKDEEQLYDELGRLSELNAMMPDFVGSDDERRALARHLARWGEPEAAPSPLEVGEGLFDEQCLMCHEATGDGSIVELIAGKSQDEVFDDLGRLEELDETMPPFEGSEADRRALAAFLVHLREGTE